MSDNWNFYFCRVDGEIASIYLDLGIAEQAPIADLPNMAYVRVFMRKPRANGLSSQEEFDTLAEIGDALSASLVMAKRCVYVGRNTTSGFRDFVFYIADPNDWEGRVKPVLLPFQDYRFECGARPDQQWRTYREFLYPSDNALQQLANRRVRDQLLKEGDELSIPREIDHWAHFPVERARAAFLDQIEAAGFTLRVPLDDAHDDLRYWVQIFHVAAADDSLDATTTDILRIAQQHGGEYDGWECPVTTVSSKH